MKGITVYYSERYDTYLYIHIIYINMFVLFTYMYAQIIYIYIILYVFIYIYTCVCMHVAYWYAHKAQGSKPSSRDSPSVIGWFHKKIPSVWFGEYF